MKPNAASRFHDLPDLTPQTDFLPWGEARALLGRSSELSGEEWLSLYGTREAEPGEARYRREHLREAASELRAAVLNLPAPALADMLRHRLLIHEGMRPPVPGLRPEVDPLFLQAELQRDVTMLYRRQGTSKHRHRWKIASWPDLSWSQQRPSTLYLQAPAAAPMWIPVRTGWFAQWAWTFRRTVEKLIAADRETSPHALLHLIELLKRPTNPLLLGDDAKADWEERFLLRGWDPTGMQRYVWLEDAEVALLRSYRKRSFPGREWSAGPVPYMSLSLVLMAWGVLGAAPPDPALLTEERLRSLLADARNAAGAGFRVPLFARQFLNSSRERVMEQPGSWEATAVWAWLSGTSLHDWSRMPFEYRPPRFHLSNPF